MAQEPVSFPPVMDPPMMEQGRFRFRESRVGGGLKFFDHAASRILSC